MSCPGGSSPWVRTMRKKILLATAWTTLIAAMIAMIIGHAGSHDLSWVTNHISTYAAVAPHREWIIAAMMLPCLTIASISILASKYKILGDADLAHVVPLFAGSGIAGLLTLAVFRETARTMSMLKSSGFDAIRQQSFHDAGLLIFFYSGIALALLFGILVYTQGGALKSKILGASVALLGLAAFPLMATPWPRILGILTAAPGLKQRASLFSLWLAMAVVLTVITGRMLQPPSRS